MLDPSDLVIIASGNLDHLRGLTRKLSLRGIESELVQPPEGCGSS